MEVQDGKSCIVASTVQWSTTVNRTVCTIGWRTVGSTAQGGCAAQSILCRRLVPTSNVDISSAFLGMLHHRYYITDTARKACLCALPITGSQINTLAAGTLDARDGVLPSRWGMRHTLQGLKIGRIDAQHLGVSRRFSVA